jgi:hypothetical protein
MGWDPVADGQYVLREFCDWADSISCIAGTVVTVKSWLMRAS